MKAEEEKKINLTYLPMPESIKDGKGIQIGLFETAPETSINRALAYVNGEDEIIINKQTLRIDDVFFTADKPNHECFVTLKARAWNFDQIEVYKICSNVQEKRFSANWKKLVQHRSELLELRDFIEQVDHKFYMQMEGEKPMLVDTSPVQNANGITSLKNLPDYYQTGTLMVHEGYIGFAFRDGYHVNRPLFIPLDHPKQDLLFFSHYVIVRDTYLMLNTIPDKESEAYRDQVKLLNNVYDSFVGKHGQLNTPDNQARILRDELHGQHISASLECLIGDLYFKAPEVMRIKQPVKQGTKVEDYNKDKRKGKKVKN